MRFAHDSAIVADFPQLSVATLAVLDVTDQADVADTMAPFYERAVVKLAGRSESDLVEVAAWRRAFSQMGLKPTQYRCASEALLRRLRKDGSLPAVHPLVDLCNAVSLAYAIPIAVFDIASVSGDLTVRRASGTETYLTFGGDTESPEPGEVIFADSAGQAHSRRWTHRQSALSAIRPDTKRVVIVSEAMHDTGQQDVAALRTELEEALSTQWTVVGRLLPPH